MKLKVIKVKDYLLLVDEEVEIKRGDYLLEKEHIINVFPNYLTDLDECKKIIAYYPLTEEAKELDLPLLPNPFEDNFNDLEWNDIADEDWKSRGGEGNRSHFMYRQGYIHGAYKALQTQSKQFSLEDMKTAIEYGHESDAPFLKEHLDNFIQSLSTQQLSKEFIPEYTWEWFNSINDTGWENISPSDMDAIIAHGLKPQPEFRKRLKTKTNSEGKEELVGTWKY